MMRARPQDCALGVARARRRRARRLRRQQRLGQRRADRTPWPSSTAPRSRSPQLADHDAHRAALDEDVVSRPGTDRLVSLRTRALEALAHDAELRAWAHNLGVTVKPSAVDAAAQADALERLPRQDGGHHRRGQGQRRVPSTGMTRELLRHRIETKLLAQAAANKVAGRPDDHGRPGPGAVREGQGDASTRCRSAARCATSWSRTRRSPTSCTRSSSPRTPISRSSPSSTRPTARRPTAAISGVVNRTSLVKPFADVAFTLNQGVVSQPVKTQFGWHLIEADGAGPAREHAAARRDAQVADPHPAREQARQKTIAKQFARAEIELSRDIQFAPGLRARRSRPRSDRRRRRRRAR